MYIIVISTLFIILLTYAVLYIVLCFMTPSKNPPESTILTTVDEISKLLDPPETSLSLLLSQRALPNQRLVRAFGIDKSTFTNCSPEIHRQFKNNTIIRLRHLEHSGNFQELRMAIDQAVEFYLPNTSSCGYATYVQAVVFVTVLTAFFNQTSSFPEPSSLRFVTEGINTLWVASKSLTFQGDSELLTELNEHLRAWIPNNPDDPFGDYPLEIILPAFETLWRLVAHAFIYVKGSPAYMLPFLEFFDQPTAAQFKVSVVENTASAHDILQEVLRLHPPTKRIKRTLTNASPFPLWIRRALTSFGINCGVVVTHEVAADIEVLQQCNAWGPSSHDFDALRHKTLTKAQKATMMAFGYGPLKCVAQSVAPRLAGLIIGGLVKNEDLVLTRGASQGDREGWQGWEISKRI